MMKNLLTTSLALFLLHLFVSDVEGQRQIDISNLPYYNFGKGVGLTSPDSVFQFNIRFRMQNRFGFQKPAGKSMSFDGQVRRLRLRFDGYVGSPKFLYVLQLSFAPGDVGEIQEGENINIIRDAVVYYRHDRHWNYGFGQTKLPGNRQRVNSSGALQLTDRSIVNSRFNIDRDFGFFINYLNENEGKFSWNIKSAISTGDGRNYTRSPDNGLAYTAKLELLPLGRFSKDGVYFEGDLVREKKPKLMVSAAYHFNHKAKRQAGVLGNDLYEARNLRSLMADMVFKYQGFALMGTYMQRLTTNAITQDKAGNTSLVYSGRGGDLQASYLLKSGFEWITRFSVLRPTPQVQNYFPRQKQVVLGLTRYIWEHAFKLQLEAGADFSTPVGAATATSPYARMQVEMGI